MRSSEAVAGFLNRGSWRLVEAIDLGMTAHVLIVERDEDRERRVLKLSRDQVPDAPALLTEYRLLRYLNRSPMVPYVPRVGRWLPALNGFWMSYVRYPGPAEKEDAGWLIDLVRALQTLHSVAPPHLPGLPDDRPYVAPALIGRLRELFGMGLKRDGFWSGLAQEDRPKLERVRGCHDRYIGLLPQAEAALLDAPGVLTHGDLAGDNIMLAQDGRLVIIDWGSARISAGWADVAALAAYSAWSRAERRCFFRRYLGDEFTEEAGRSLEILTRLHRYRCCVRSLLWLNASTEGLDAVGRAFFERQLEAMCEEV